MHSATASKGATSMLNAGYIIWGKYVQLGRYDFHFKSKIDQKLIDQNCQKLRKCQNLRAVRNPTVWKGMCLWCWCDYCWDLNFQCLFSFQWSKLFFLIKVLFLYFFPRTSKNFVWRENCQLTYMFYTKLLNFPR
jgi:hypothetical protein